MLLNYFINNYKNIKSYSPFFLILLEGDLNYSNLKGNESHYDEGLTNVKPINMNSLYKSKIYVNLWFKAFYYKNNVFHMVNQYLN